MEFNEHCDVCHGLSYTVDNPIVLCQHRGCLEGRHRFCWADNQPPSLSTIQRMQHRCYLHGTVRTAAFRSARKRTVERAAAVMADRPRHNLPPPHSSSTSTSQQQRINQSGSIPASSSLPLQSYQPPSQWRATLAWNCQQLGVKVCSSSLGSIAGNGVFTVKSIPREGLVGYFNGKFMPLNDWQALVNGGPDTTTPVFTAPPALVPEEDYKADAQRGIWRCLHPQQVADASFEYVCLISRQCPMGYINDPRQKEKFNVAVRFPKFHDCLHSMDGILDWRMLPVYATVNIAAGEELFIDYGWDSKMWMDMQRRTKQAATLQSTTLNHTSMKDPELKVVVAASTSVESESLDLPPNKRTRLQSATIVLPPLPSSTGCPPVTISTRLSPDATSLRITTHPLFEQLSTLHRQHRAAYDALSLAAASQLDLGEQLIQERRISVQLNSLPPESPVPIDPFSDSDKEEEEVIDEETLAAIRIQRRDLLRQKATLVRQRLANAAVVLAIRETAFRVDCGHSHAVHQLEQALSIPPAARLVGIELNPGPVHKKIGREVYEKTKLIWTAVHYRLHRIHTVTIRIGDSKLPQLLSMPRLHSLTILDVTITYWLGSILSQLPKLEYLHLHKSCHTDEEICMIFQLPSGCRRVGFQSFKRMILYQTLLTCQMVQVLPPSLTDIQPNGFASIDVLPLLSRFKDLKYLLYRRRDLEFDVLGSIPRVLIELISELPKLKTLRFTQCWMNLEQVSMILRNGYPHLTELSCSFVYFFPEVKQRLLQEVLDRGFNLELSEDDGSIQVHTVDPKTSTLQISYYHYDWYDIISDDPQTKTAILVEPPAARLVGIELNPGPGSPVIASPSATIDYNSDSDQSTYSQPSRPLKCQTIQRQHSNISAAMTISPPASPSKVNSSSTSLKRSRALSESAAASIVPTSSPSSTIAVCSPQGTAASARSMLLACEEEREILVDRENNYLTRVKRAQVRIEFAAAANPPTEVELAEGAFLKQELVDLEEAKKAFDERTAGLTALYHGAMKQSTDENQSKLHSIVKRQRTNQVTADHSIAAAASSKSAPVASLTKVDSNETHGTPSPTYDFYPRVELDESTTLLPLLAATITTPATVKIDTLKLNVPSRSTRPRSMLIPSQAEIDWIMHDSSESDNESVLPVNESSAAVESKLIPPSSLPLVELTSKPSLINPCWPIFQPASSPLLLHSRRYYRRHQSTKSSQSNSSDVDSQPPRTSTTAMMNTQPLSTRRTRGKLIDSNSTAIVTPPAALLVGIELNPGPGDLIETIDASEVPLELAWTNIPRTSGPIQIDETGWTRSYVYCSAYVGGPLEAHIVAPPYARLHICWHCTRRGVTEAPAVLDSTTLPLYVSTHAWCSSCRRWSQLSSSEISPVKPLRVRLKQRQAQKKIRHNLMATSVHRNSLYYLRKPSKWTARLQQKLKHVTLPSILLPLIVDDSTAASESLIPPAARLVGIELNPGPGLTFVGHSFYLDYIRLGDELPNLLFQLGATVRSSMPSTPSAIQQSIFVFDSTSDATATVSTQLTSQQSMRNRFASIIVFNQSSKKKSIQLPATMDNLSRARCIGMRICSRMEVLLAAETKLAAPPCMIIRDIKGLYLPEVTHFPMVPVLKIQPADVSGHATVEFERDSSGAIELAHTFPQLNWNMEQGQSAFLIGGRSMDERSGVTVNTSKPKVKLQYCEWCRIEIADEQMHLNTPAHQQQFDHPDRLVGAQQCLKAMENSEFRQRAWAIVMAEYAIKDAAEAAVKNVAKEVSTPIIILDPPAAVPMLNSPIPITRPIIIRRQLPPAPLFNESSAELFNDNAVDLSESMPPVMEVNNLPPPPLLIAVSSRKRTTVLSSCKLNVITPLQFSSSLIPLPASHPALVHCALRSPGRLTARLKQERSLLLTWAWSFALPQVHPALINVAFSTRQRKRKEQQEERLLRWARAYILPPAAPLIGIELNPGPAASTNLRSQFSFPHRYEPWAVQPSAFLSLPEILTFRIFDFLSTTSIVGRVALLRTDFYIKCVNYAELVKSMATRRSQVRGDSNFQSGTASTEAISPEDEFLRCDERVAFLLIKERMTSGISTLTLRGLASRIAQRLIQTRLQEMITLNVVADPAAQWMMRSELELVDAQEAQFMNGNHLLLALLPDSWCDRSWGKDSIRLNYTPMERRVQRREVKGAFGYRGFYYMQHTYQVIATLHCLHQIQNPLSIQSMIANHCQSLPSVIHQPHNFDLDDVEEHQATIMKFYRMDHPTNENVESSSNVYECLRFSIPEVNTDRGLRLHADPILRSRLQSHSTESLDRMKLLLASRLRFIACAELRFIATVDASVSQSSTNIAATATIAAASVPAALLVGVELNPGPTFFRQKRSSWKSIQHLQRGPPIAVHTAASLAFLNQPYRTASGALLPTLKLLDRITWESEQFIRMNPKMAARFFHIRCQNRPPRRSVLKVCSIPPHWRTRRRPCSSEAPTPLLKPELGSSDTTMLELTEEPFTPNHSITYDRSATLISDTQMNVSLFECLPISN